MAWLVMISSCGAGGIIPSYPVGGWKYRLYRMHAGSQLTTANSVDGLWVMFLDTSIEKFGVCYVRGSILYSNDVAGYDVVMIYYYID